MNTIEAKPHVPKKILTRAEFNSLVTLFKNSDKVSEKFRQILKTLGPISIQTRYKYRNCNFITIYQPSLWTMQFLKFVNNFLEEDQREVMNYSLKHMTMDDYLSKLNNTPVKYGCLKEIVQSGHSYYKVKTRSAINHTLRSYIFAETRALPRQLAIPIQWIIRWFPNAKVGDVLKLDSFCILYKRDPAIWEGSLQLANEIWVITGDRIGVSPWSFTSLNMDVDGDTIVLYFVQGIEASMEMRQLLQPLMFPRINRFVHLPNVLLAFGFLLQQTRGDGIQEKLPLHELKNCEFTKEDFSAKPSLPMWTEDSRIAFVLDGDFKMLLGPFERFFSKDLGRDLPTIFDNFLKVLADFEEFYELELVRLYQEWVNLQIVEIYEKGWAYGFGTMSRKRKLEESLVQCNLLELISSQHLKGTEEQYSKLITTFNPNEGCTEYLWENYTEEMYKENRKFLDTFLASSKMLPKICYNTRTFITIAQDALYIDGHFYWRNSKNERVLLLEDLNNFIPPQLLVNVELVKELFKSDLWFE